MQDIIKTIGGRNQDHKNMKNIIKVDFSWTKSCNDFEKKNWGQQTQWLKMKQKEQENQQLICYKISR